MNPQRLCQGYLEQVPLHRPADVGEGEPSPRLTPTHRRRKSQPG